tara:strand:- start:8 stop:268 length:261 start_codon:yes stop_codon:yes gene_type:complete
MTRKELRELIRSTIKEYTGTGSSGGNATDGNNMTSQRIGGSFKTAEDEIEFYTGQNAGEGGKGYQSRGMEKSQPIGNPNRTKMFKF